MKARARFSLRRNATVSIIAVAMCASALLGTGAGHAATEEVVVKPPQGAAKPVSGTGMGTQAALDDPRCNTAEAYSVYGRWDFSTVGTGPFCVRPFEDGEDNGGATSRGVTADAVKIVAVLPSDARSEAQKQSAPPRFARGQLHHHVGGHDPRLPVRVSALLRDVGP